MECISYQSGQIATGAILAKVVANVLPKSASSGIGEAFRKIEDAGFKLGESITSPKPIPPTQPFINPVPKKSQPLDNPEQNPQTPKEKIPCVSKVSPSQTNILLAFLGGVRVEALCSNDLTFDKDNLNHEYDKHASNWGINGNRNNTNLEIFKQTLIEHINKPEIKIIKGTYRGDPAIFYYDPRTNLTVFTYPNGELWGAWKLDDIQVKYLKTSGNVQ